MQVKDLKREVKSLQSCQGCIRGGSLPEEVKHVGIEAMVEKISALETTLPRKLEEVEEAELQMAEADQKWMQVVKDLAQSW